MLNRWMGIGRLGHGPRLSYSQGGIAKCLLRVATDTVAGKNQDGTWNRRTDWHTIIVWGNQAVACDKHLEKGLLVYVEGRLQYRQGQDRQGQEKWFTEIIAERVEFLQRQVAEGRGAAVSPAERPPAAPGAPPESTYDSGDDIPF